MPRTHDTLTELFGDIADAIRGKTGDRNAIVADDFPSAIENIPSGGGENIAEEMEMIDRSITGQIPWRPFSARDYAESEVNKVQNLIEKLGGN